MTSAAYEIDERAGNPQPQSPDEPTSDSLTEEEIRCVQVKINQSLERIIKIGGDARDVGRDTNLKLLENRSTMSATNENLHKQSRAQDQAEYNIKTGFSWTGALKKKLSRRSSMPKPVSDNEIPQLPMRKVRRSTSFARGQSAAKNKQNKHFKNVHSSTNSMPVGYDAQLDSIESIVDDLARQSKEMNEELTSENAAMDVVDNKLLDVTEKTEKQNSRIRRRFGLK